ncbi:hypothetical protein PAL_GLEAN10012529 [Pteropus alecto]|uniref:Uncharacterized protein n=1 Tax=Pteropus alecto TaxID=9402 RepID=L5K935_PTEAL|nr:hypothetical protein PAL_GLEAN10012529 [Pteropus alecto]
MATTMIKYCQRETKTKTQFWHETKRPSGRIALSDATADGKDVGNGNAGTVSGNTHRYSPLGAQVSKVEDALTRPG